MNAKKYKKDFSKTIKNLQVYMNSVMETLINSFFVIKKGFMYTKKSDETSLSNKNYFYSTLNMEDIDVNFRHAKTVCKEFKRKNVGEYHDLYVLTIHGCLQMY